MSKGGIGRSILSVPVAADEIELLFGGFNEPAILPVRCSGAELVASRERSVAVGTSRAVCTVVPGGAFVLVYSSAADSTAGISGAFCGIAEALASRVVSEDGRFLVYGLGELAGVE
jgi:hypothetical protein